MRCSDIVGMVVPASAAHALRLSMVGDNFAVVSKLLSADCTHLVLLPNLPVQELTHFCC